MSVLSDKLNLIWYGDFEVHQTNGRCETIKLSDHTEIKRVYRVDGNLWPTYRKGAPSNSFDTLECGYGYIIELEDNASINIPHANFSPNGSSPRGLLVKEVDISTPTPSPSPTPTPTPIEGCIPSSYTTVLYPAESPDKSTTIDLGTLTFRDVGDFGFLPSDFSESSPPVSLFVKDDGFVVVDISLVKVPKLADEPNVYFECKSSFCGGNCYGGKVIKLSSGDYEVNLELISSVKTPTPSPTPTPQPPKECGKPNDADFGVFDLEAIGKVAVGEPGHTTSSSGIQGANTHIYSDIAADVLAKFGLSDNLGKYEFLQIQPGVPFGNMRGKLTYQREFDPSEDNAIDSQIIGSLSSYIYLEGSDLPSGISEFIPKAFFKINKNIQCVRDSSCTSNEIFLEFDGECYAGELNTDKDHNLFPFADSNPAFGQSIFLTMLRKV